MYGQAGLFGNRPERPLVGSHQRANRRETGRNHVLVFFSFYLLYLPETCLLTGSPIEESQLDKLTTEKLSADQSRMLDNTAIVGTAWQPLILEERKFEPE
jgi:hypothetical protein